jgi:hypothetical protein
MRSIAMASLKMVGTKLGEKPNRRGAEEVSMVDVVEYCLQHRGFSPTSEFQDVEEYYLQHRGFSPTSEFQSAWSQALSNAFHHGYLLRGILSGQEYYGIPSMPEPELIELRNKFRKFVDSPDEKRQLIDKLIRESASTEKSAKNDLETHDDVDITQKLSVEEEDAKQFLTAKTLLKNNIAKLEEEIKKLDNESAAKKQVVSNLKSILAQIQ